MEHIGLIGNLLLTFCGVPELIRTIKTKECHLSWGMTTMWFLGEVFCFFYGLDLQKPPLIINYTFNLTLSSFMMIYKIKNALRNE